MPVLSRRARLRVPWGVVSRSLGRETRRQSTASSSGERAPTYAGSNVEDVSESSKTLIPLNPLYLRVLVGLPDSNRTSGPLPSVRLHYQPMILVLAVHSRKSSALSVVLEPWGGIAPPASRREPGALFS